MSEVERQRKRRKIVRAVAYVVGALALTASVGVNAASAKKKKTVTLSSKPLTTIKVEELTFDPYTLNSTTTFVGPVYSATYPPILESEQAKDNSKSPKKPPPPPPPPPHPKPKPPPPPPGPKK